MVQTQTTRFHDRNAPGLMVTAAQERETESAALPLLPQIISLTWGGTDPADVGDYVLTFPLPSGASYVLTYTSAGDPLATEALNLASVIATDPVIGKLYSVGVGGLIVSLQATSYATQINVAAIGIVLPGGATTTLVAAETQASGGASLRMGVLYRRAATEAQGPALFGTTRQPLGGPASRLVTGTTLAQIRGMVAREANSTELSSTFIETNPDQYTAPDVFPGLLRGIGCFVVDPDSAAITVTTAALYAVIEGGGGGTIPGALTTDATGNVQVWGGGADLVRPVDAEKTPVFGTPRQRLLRAKINRTN